MRAKKIMGTVLSCLSTTAMGVAAGYMVAEKKINKVSNEEKDKLQLRINKFYDYFQLMNHWVMLKNAGKSLEQFFLDKDIRVIAVYGMGEVGHRLAEELKNTSVEIKYVIDIRKELIISDFEVYTLEEHLEEVDAIIVTPLFDYYAIEKKLQEVCNYEVISLEDVVYYLD